ncbi:DUF2877 domain-containing protein, partial [Providencia rettgeri]|nr:DUF2877 domain-containing protein [Providencia rettgeri]
TGYILLGDIIERITGKSLGLAVRELLHFDTIGLESAYWESLEKALNREYRENMQQLIQSLVDAKETNIYPQFLEILNIGSSSGSDMLFGLRDALYITHYFGENYVD